MKIKQIDTNSHKNIFEEEVGSEIIALFLFVPII